MNSLKSLDKVKEYGEGTLGLHGHLTLQELLQEINSYIVPCVRPLVALHLNKGCQTYMNPFEVDSHIYY